MTDTDTAKACALEIHSYFFAKKTLVTHLQDEELFNHEQL